MAGEWKVRQALPWQKATALNDVIIADDRGLTQIDHLVLTPAGIVVLETKNYGGKLYDRGPQATLDAIQVSRPIAC